MTAKKPYTNIYIKRRIYSLKASILAYILENAKKGTPKNTVLTQVKSKIYSVGQELGLSVKEMNLLFSDSKSLYTHVSRKTNRKMSNERIYLSLRAKILGQEMEKDTNELMYQVEYRKKHDYIYGPAGVGIIESARNSSYFRYSPFFLCSSHPKPAKDHAHHEGKMYYDAEWETYADPEDADRIRAYIRNRKLMSIQDVVGPPVYLLTRRNCKHFFRHLPLEEVLTHSPKALLKKYKMYHKDEKPATLDQLEYRRIYKIVITLEELNRTIPNKFLDNDLASARRHLSVLRSRL